MPDKGAKVLEPDADKDLERLTKKLIKRAAELAKKSKVIQRQRAERGETD